MARDTIRVDFQMACELVDMKAMNLQLPVTRSRECSIRAAAPHYPVVVLLLDDDGARRAVVEHPLDLNQGDESVGRHGAD
jgi:hypothetical protein